MNAAPSPTGPVALRPASYPETYPGYPTPAEEQNQLLELWHTVWQSKWSILGLVLVAGVIALLYANTRVPLYRATATVLIEPRTNRPVQMQEAYDPGVGTSDYFSTQLELVRTRQVAADMVDKLGLTSHPEFTGQVAQSISVWEVLNRWLPFLPASDSADSKSAADAEPERPEPEISNEMAAAHRESVISQIIARTNTQGVPRSQLMRVHFTALTPEFARTGANALAEVYIEQGLESRLKATQLASRWLTDKLGEIRIKLERAEANLQAYRDRERLVNLGGVRGLIEQDVLNSSQRLRDARNKKTDLATTYWKIQQAGDDPARLEEITDLFSLALVASAKTAAVNAEDGLELLRKRYGDKHPQISAAEERLKTAQRSFHDQLRLAAQNIRTEFEIAREAERVNAEIVETGKEQIRNMDRKDYEIRALQREVDINRQLYDLFLARFKETDTSGSYEPITARIVDPAILPWKPFLPDKTRILRIGLILGLAAGLLLAVLRKMLAQGIRTVEELETITGVPTLGVLPFIHERRKQKLIAAFHADPRTPYAEGIRSIRTGIHLSDVDRRFKRVLVTSATPHEGKSSIAATLALSFAASEKVLLLDADLRAPSVRRTFNVPATSPGLLELLTGEAKFEDCLHRDAASGIDLLTVRQVPPNPAEIIGSASFAKLLQALTTRYDRIIVDAPPTLVASDVALLSRCVDAVLFVALSDTTHRRTAAAAIKQLRLAQAHLVGAVINAVRINRSPYYRDTHYYAHKYYGS